MKGKISATLLSGKVHFIFGLFINLSNLKKMKIVVLDGHALNLGIYPGTDCMYWEMWKYASVLQQIWLLKDVKERKLYSPIKYRCRKMC